MYQQTFRASYGHVKRRILRACAGKPAGLVWGNALVTALLLVLVVPVLCAAAVAGSLAWLVARVVVLAFGAIDYMTLEG